MKQQIKTIEKIVKNLPERQYNFLASSSIPVSGDILLKRGIRQVEGEDVDPLKTYYQKSSIKNKVNHKRRAIRAFKKNGIEGLFRYVEPFLIPEQKEAYKQKLQIALS